MKFHDQGMLHLITAFALTLLPLRAVPLAEAPSLSVHEKAYGTQTINGHRESIQELEIRIVSRTRSPDPFVVECFFLKNDKKGGSPVVDDSVIFEVYNPHATYEVKAKPIAQRTGTVGTSSEKKGKSGASSKSASLKIKPVELPRSGWVVRVLKGGALLCQQCSAHGVESLLKDDPELLVRAASSRSIRHPDAGELELRR